MDTFHFSRNGASVLLLWGLCAQHRAGPVSSYIHLQQQYYDRSVSFPVVPLAPDLHLEPLNCTTVLVRWQLAPRNSVGVQGYKLFYREESQSESAPLLLSATENKRTIGGLGKSCWGVSQLLWPLGWIHFAFFCLRGERWLRPTHWTTDHLWSRVNQVVSSWLVNHEASVKLVGSKDKMAL